MSDQTTLVKPAPPTTEPAPNLYDDTNILDALDRCDRDTCKAAAFVKVILLESERLPEGGELMFCSHHYNKVEEGLKPFARDIFDERHKLKQNKLLGTENS